MNDQSAQPCGCDRGANYVCYIHQDARRNEARQVGAELDEVITMAVEDAHMNANIREAWKLTHGDRRAAYGSPAQVFASYAKLWTGLLAPKLREGAEVSAEDVTLMMTALKLARQTQTDKDDNIVDAHGYLIILDEIRNEG